MRAISQVQAAKQDPLTFAKMAGAGIVGAEVSDGGLVTLNLQPPHSFRAERPLRVGDRIVRGSFIIVGVPHYVVFLRDELWSQDILPLGRAIRMHPELQPAGANV